MCSNKWGEEVAILISIKLEPLKRSCISLPMKMVLSTSFYFLWCFPGVCSMSRKLLCTLQTCSWKPLVIGVFLRWIRLTHDRVKQFHYWLANFCCHRNLTPTCFVNFTMATVLCPWWKSIILQSCLDCLEFRVYLAIRLNHCQSEQNFISAPIDFS